MTSELDSLSSVYLAALETEMRSVLGAGNHSASRQDPFLGMIHYHMGWADADLHVAHGNSGKRIRPLLCLLSCAAAGGDWQQALPAAAAIEILHNFSLVHDDIEDNSPTRRGRATLWSLWGQPQAINTGDAMFALAHLGLARLADRGVPSETVVRAWRRFDETCVDLTRGQYVDMSFETQDGVEVAEYVAMITGKTSVLVSLAAELGALIAGADESRTRHFADFGLNLGLAFQVQDDILGIWGDESVTGKSVATDIKTRKKTLPVLYGLSHSHALCELYAGIGNDDDFVRRAVAMLDESGARLYATSEAERYTAAAISNLASARPAEPAATALRQLTDQLLRRNA